jgi:hypothetical protein
MELTTSNGGFVDAEPELAMPASQALTVAQPAIIQSAPTFMPAEIARPVMSVAQAVALQNEMRELVKALMVEGEDFGIIGSVKARNPKRMLFKAGAEKLAVFFGFTVSVDLQESDRQIKPGDSFPWIFYRHKARAFKGSQLIATCDGSCNSFESKYRWQWLDDDPPSKPIQERMLEDKSGRWQKYGSDTVWQRRIDNPEIYSQINTLDKMSQKRAYSGVMQLATASSGFFSSYNPIDEPEDSDKRHGKRKATARDAGEKDGPTRFWEAVAGCAVTREEAQAIAKGATDKRYGWEEAIGKLPKA